MIKPTQLLAFLSVLFFIQSPCMAQEIGIEVNWKPLVSGITFKEFDAPDKSVVGDSKIFLLRIDPRLCKFSLLCASEHGKRNRTAQEWANEFKMTVTVNAGMYNTGNKKTNKGYMKNFNHVNNPRINGHYNVMMAMNPKDKKDDEMKLIDLTCCRWDSIRSLYHSFSQGMRMVSCSGEKMAWDKNPTQSCSMVLCASDQNGMLYYVFTRSPYTHQKMIGYLYRIIPNISTTVYLEGGPETSLYIQTPDTTIIKYGSYVSHSFAHDRNDHYWSIPNVIGIRSK